MTAARTREEYDAAALRNTRIEGSGPTTRTIMPCPFCAEPDWLVFPITAGLDDYAGVSRPTRCAACGRSARFAISRAADGTVSWELVQTGGPDPDEWLRPWPRRETPAAVPDSEHRS